MIAALRRRANVARVRLEKLTREADRAIDRRLVKLGPPLGRAASRLGAGAGRARRWAGRRLRPLAARAFRLLARIERVLLRGRDAAVAAATAASSLLTPQRAACAAIAAAAACLFAAQFVDYRAIEIGQPGYAGLEAAPPTTEVESAGAAHAYLLAPLAALAAALAAFAAFSGRRRLGLSVSVLGLIALAVALAVDRPAGLDVGTATARFAGAEAVLLDGFYAEVAAAAGLLVGGLLLAFPLPGRAARPGLRKAGLAGTRRSRPGRAQKLGV